MTKELYGKSLLQYDGREEVLEYYLLSSEAEISEKKINIYGIEVIKRNIDSLEKSTIADITIRKDFAINIIDKIKENTVTPVHLYDVVENFL